MARRRLFSYPLSLALIVAGLVSITGGWIAWWNYRGGLENTRELAGELFDRIAHQTADATAASLGTAPPAVEAIARMPGAHGDDLARRFLAVLAANPGFAWVSYGDATGGFTGATRIDGKLSLNQSSITDGVSKVVERDVDPKTGAWLLADHGAAKDYDARTRPYYKDAAAKHAPLWTEPYAFGGNFGLGITYARPDYDEAGLLHGVFTVDIGLGQLRDVVRAMKVSEHGEVAIVSREGYLLAHPTLALTDGKGGLVKSPGFDKGLVRSLEVPGTPGFVVYVTAPESDFTAAETRRVMTSLIISLIAVLVAVALASLLARRISGPLTVLAAEMREAGEFKISDKPLPPSLFREIELMNRALAKMKGGLKSFASYVPRDLVRAVLASGQEATLSGETRELTVYFSDIAGFTTLAESMSPDALVKFLGEYFDEASKIIAAEKGTVDKYLGDGIMAFWGAPEKLADHAAHACLAALRAHAMVTRLAEQGTKISARIGVATGEVVVGNIGSPERMNYTVMGDTANLASRLEGLNKQYGTALMISEATYLQAKQVVIARPVDVVAVKGKSRGVRVYELLARVADGDVVAEAVAAFSTAALDSYLIREFAAAAGSWEQVLAKRPGDPAATLMRARALAYVDAPPPPEWNGVTTATEK